jgi:hypothetical protein
MTTTPSVTSVPSMPSIQSVQSVPSVQSISAIQSVSSIPRDRPRLAAEPLVVARTTQLPGAPIADRKPNTPSSNLIEADPIADNAVPGLPEPTFRSPSRPDPITVPSLGLPIGSSPAGAAVRTPSSSFTTPVARVQRTASSGGAPSTISPATATGPMITSVSTLVGAQSPIGPTTPITPPTPVTPQSSAPVLNLAAQHWDAGSVAISAGVAQRSADGSVMFGPPEPALEAPAVSRAEQAGSPPPAPSTSAAGPSAPAATAGAPGNPGGLDIDELVRRLYDPLSARIKAELRLDRERAGLITDLRR